MPATSLLDDDVSPITQEELVQQAMQIAKIYSAGQFVPLTAVLPGLDSVSYPRQIDFNYNQSSMVCMTVAVG
jgi:hypothetical protein